MPAHFKTYVVSLEELLGKRSTHSDSALNGAGAEVSLSHLSSRLGLVNIKLGHWREVTNEESNCLVLDLASRTSGLGKTLEAPPVLELTFNMWM